MNRRAWSTLEAQLIKQLTDHFLYLEVAALTSTAISDGYNHAVTLANSALAGQKQKGILVIRGWVKRPPPRESPPGQFFKEVSEALVVEQHRQSLV